MKITALTILFLCGALGCGCALADNNGGKGPSEMPPQIRFGYWNDNFPLDTVFGENLNRGNDDNITAAFMLQAAQSFRNDEILFELFESVVTNKEAGYRTDILMARTILKHKTSWGSFSIGPGVLCNNRLGGERIQNGYHSLTGIRNLRLPYLRDNGIGMSFFSDVDVRIFEGGGTALHAVISNTYRNDILPNVGKAGIEYRQRMRLLSRGIAGIRFYTGYFEYYNEKTYFRSMFDEGVTAGGMLSYGVPGSYHVSFYCTVNQYGLEQPRFGLILTCNWRENMSFQLSDISFP